MLSKLRFLVVGLLVAACGAPEAVARSSSSSADVECVELKHKKTRIRVDGWSGEIVLLDHASKRDAERIVGAIVRNRLVHRVEPNEWSSRTMDIARVRFVSFTNSRDIVQREPGVRYLTVETSDPERPCGGWYYFFELRKGRIELRRIRPWIG